MDDESILRTAVGLGFLSDAQLLACRKLMAAEAVSAPEALTRAGKMTRDQIRAALLLARYDRDRCEDQALAQFIVRNGFLDRAAVDSCLASQDEPFEQGDEIPRLTDVLVDRGLATGEQIQAMLRAKAQMEATRLQMQAGVHRAPAPVVPSRAPAPAPVRAPSEATVILTKRPPASAARFDEEAFARHRASAGPITETLDVALRRAHVKDMRRGDMLVVVIEPVGDVDARSAERFEALLHAFIDDGGVQLVLDAERLARLTREGAQAISGAAQRCREAGGDLRACNVSAAVQKTIETASVRVYDSERGAVMSFKYQ
jgi:anti-anti-sigma factor